MFNSTTVLSEICSFSKKKPVNNQLRCPFAHEQNSLSKDQWSRGDLSKISFPKLDVNLIHRFHKESTFGFQKPGILTDLQRARKDRMKELKANSTVSEQNTTAHQPNTLGKHKLFYSNKSCINQQQANNATQ